MFHYRVASVCIRPTDCANRRKNRSPGLLLSTLGGSVPRGTERCARLSCAARTGTPGSLITNVCFSGRKLVYLPKHCTQYPGFHKGILLLENLLISQAFHFASYQQFEKLVYLFCMPSRLYYSKSVLLYSLYFITDGPVTFIFRKEGTLRRSMYRLLNMRINVFIICSHCAFYWLLFTLMHSNLTYL